MRRAFFVTLFFLTSCQILKPYHYPEVKTPCEWKGPTVDGESLHSAWWEIFEDHCLNELELQAIANSPTLQSALQKVIEARAIAEGTLSNFYPAVNLVPNYNAASERMQFQNPINDALNFRANVTEFQFPLMISYEVDLWNKFKNTYFSADANAEFVAESYLDALLSLQADVANNYFLVRGLATEKTVLEAAITSRRNSVEILQARFDAGLINFEDVSRAETELALTESELAENRRRYGLAENALAVLVGEVASCFSIEAEDFITPPPQVKPYLPSSILIRRPDVRAQERNIASLYYEVGVVYASFFPNLQLTSLLGFASPEFNSLFSWKSRFMQFALTSSQFLFDAGLRRSALKAANARVQQALFDYMQTTLIAFREVEDALQALQRQKEQADYLSDGVEAAQTTYTLSMDRYMQGLDNYLNVVDAERSLLDAERESVKILGIRYLSTVQLIRAFGGGWGDSQ